MAAGAAGFLTGADKTKLDGVASGATDDSALTDHLNDTTDAHDATAISYAGSTNVAATNVEGAIDELESEKARLEA